MFDRLSFDNDDFDDHFSHKHDKDIDDLYKNMNDDFEKHFTTTYHGPSVMEVVIIFACVVGAVVLISLLCRCCRGRTRGRVLAPPPAADTTLPAAYPQQQYVTVTAMPAVYPNSSPYPTVYPVTTAYPTGSAPYPAGSAPYPVHGAPYPPAGAPYPDAGAPYPAMPLPTTAPSAPDSNALPPSYDQVVGKQSPYNPTYHPQ